MMKLILCLTLTWMLSTTGGALQCKDQTSYTVNCKPGEYCAAVARKEITVGFLDTHETRQLKKSCLSSSLCRLGDQTFSLSFGRSTFAAFVRCCNTTNCNSKDVPYPDVQPNDLMCFTCEYGFCYSMVQCVGDQDRCISWNVTDGGKNKRVLGCASRDLCEAAVEPELKSNLGVSFDFTSKPKCCDTDLCNSAWTVKLNVVPLLLGLILFVVC